MIARAGLLSALLLLAATGARAWPLRCDSCVPWYEKDLPEESRHEKSTEPPAKADVADARADESHVDEEIKPGSCPLSKSHAPCDDLCRRDCER